MSVVIETTLGDVTVDLYLNERPRACLNFLKLCKLKYYNFNLFHTISRGFIAQTGDPTGTRTGGESVFGVIDGPSKRYFEAENEPRIKHTRPGLISFVGGDKNMIGSQFFLTLGEDLTYLDEKHCVFGEVVEGVDILEAINEVICDNDDRPYQDVRIIHTVVLDDPFPDPKGLLVPTRSPSPSAERLAGGRIAPDEEIDETSGRSAQEVAEMQAEREAKARATILEMVGDIPDAEMAPPENVLFVCKLNPVTTDDDLEIIFSRFGKIKFCEVIRDRKSGDSLQYAFIEFEEQKSCEDAYFKMGNVLIDDRRIHVDFSQSVSKVKWLGKGRGVAHYDEKGNKRMNDANNDVGKGNYKINNGHSNNMRGGKQNESSRRERRSPDRNNRQRNHSPRRNRNRSRSTTRESHRGRSPQGNRKSMYSLQHSRDRRATDLRRRRSRSPIPRRRSRSPIYRKKLSRSPQVSPRRYDRRSSHRNRSRSPRRSSSRNRQKSYPGRRPTSPIKDTKRSKRDVSREKSKSVEKYKHSSREKSLLTERHKEEPTRSHKHSESSENKKSPVRREDSSSKRSPRRSASVQEGSSSKKHDSTVSPRRLTKVHDKKERSSESVSKEKPIELEKQKTSKTKKKKSKVDKSSEESESESEEDKPKQKKSKKKVESSTDSSSNESDSSSSSQEEKAKSKSKRHKNKKTVKVKKSKQSKKRRQEYSSSSESGSSSSKNSDSSGDKYKRKKSKKKKSKKSSAESD